MITFIALTTAHRALQEGIIGYQSEIREAYENLCAYLQDKFPAIDLAAVFSQPDNPAIKENFVAQVEQRVGKFEPTLQGKTSKVIEAIGL